jgi:teichuronic acid exporter
MTLGEQMRSGALWLSASKIASRGLQFALGIVLARLLIPEDFGFLVTVQIFTGIAGLLADGGMGQALIRKKNIGRYEYSTYFTAQLVICGGIYALFFLAAPWFALWYENPIYKDLLRVSALSFPLRALQNTPRVLLHRDMRYKAIGIIQWCGLLLSGLISIAMAWLGMGVWSLVLSGLVSGVLLTIPLYWVAGWKPHFTFSLESAREMSSYGVKSTVNDLMDYIRTQVPNLLIGQMLGPAVLGIFNKADTLRIIPLELVSGSVYQPLFRGLAQTQDNIDQSKYIYLRSIALTMAYCLPLYVGLWWIADPFVLVFYGEKWHAAAEPLEILATSGLFSVLTNQSGAVAAARNLLGREIFIQTETAILLVIAVLAGIPWGLAGIAWGMVVALGFLSLRMTYLACRSTRTGFGDLVMALRPAILLNLCLAGMLYAVDYLWQYAGSDRPMAYICVMSGVGGLFYAALFLMLPIKSLASEATRWKRILRLTEGRQETA